MEAAPASIDAILQLITTTADPRTIDSALRKIKPPEARDLLLSARLPDGQDPLNVLDPTTNSMGVLHILVSRLSSEHPPTPDVLQLFCASFDPEQLRFAPDRVMQLGKAIASLTSHHSAPEQAIPFLYNLLTRFLPSLSILSTLHTDFVLACVKTQRFRDALPVIRTPITSLMPDELTYNDNLVYHYTAGVAFAALGLYSDAEDAWEICVTAPSTGLPAALQLEALKKLKLVQLIAKGRTSPVPKYTNGVLTRVFSHSPYQNFMQHYPDRTEKLRDIAEKEESLFSEEKNLGLVQLALSRAPRWKLKKLTATYVTLGLTEIGKAVGISDEEEVRNLVLEMIESSDIAAKISADGTVVFSDPLPTFTKQDVDNVLRLAHQQQAVLTSVDSELGRNKDFLLKAVAAASKGRDEWSMPVGGPGDHMDPTAGGSGRPMWAMGGDVDIA